MNTVIIRSRPTLVTLAEENPAYVFLVRQGLNEQYADLQLLVLEDGRAASQALQSCEEELELPRPDLVLLDLNLQITNGEEILRQMRHSRRCRHIPVVILTSQDVSTDRAFPLIGDITRYFRKPSNFHEFFQAGAALKAVLRFTNSPPA